MGLGGFIIGTLLGQFGGGWTYRYAKRRLMFTEWKAAVASGLAATVVSSFVFILTHVHDWAGGVGSSWGVSVFFGVCSGIVQGALFRGGPLDPRSTLRV
jgi:hypothetical protein